MEAAKILIVDDEKFVRRTISRVLSSEGFATFEASNGPDALRMAQEQPFDLMILDIVMDGMDGFQVIRTLRDQGILLPVFVLSGRQADNDKILALGIGADDYITKPFSMRELMARVKANIRRSTMVPAEPSSKQAAGRLELGRITIDTELLMAYKDGAPLDLTQREYELLKFLASNPGKVFSREALMENVWNYEGYVGDVRAVDVAVRRLREKVEDDPASPQFVVTRRGLGYLFNA